MNPLTLIPAAYMGWAKVAAVGALVAAVLAGVAWVRHDWIQDGITSARPNVPPTNKPLQRPRLKPPRPPAPKNKP